MESGQQINIDQQEWRVIPPELRDGLTRQTLSKRKLRNWALVLQAKQIPCRSEQIEGARQLLVPIADFEAACAELRIFEEENHNWPPPPPAPHPQQENTATTIWVLIALSLFYVLTQQQIDLFGHTPVDWYALGNADAGKILAGQWWRPVTALTLHAGWIHLFGNVVVGGVFVNRLCRDLGSGLGWSLVLASGILGNLANAIVQSPDHRSIGASTAVFGAVGLLATINLLRYRSQLRRHWLMPIAAALALLALLGTGGKNTDIGAHLFGFLFGIGLGLVSGFFTRKGRQLKRKIDKILAFAALFVISVAWLSALLV
ncbi:MAG: rhomboid family intramembrane serine protease [Deltaproteobacteria bacterium]|nr:rhomboid family intramembrane serine protease [Deltaproteobacteria bacterium]